MDKRHKTAVIALITVLVLLFGQGSTLLAQENVKKLDDKGGYMVADLVVMRPLGIVATAAGAVAYVLSLPFSLAGGNEPEARQKLMGDPASYTFTRPLGDF
ncbi:MAG: hypothetical protein LJE96_19355 [Deltaproteobacteria bacterium]|jgi:hypothetical protein|nr:hypothetical protein [Deltaproteobacteria bacterium]